jgi:Reverse transcriptase (RNA-dependent DNA polymerase).
MRKVVRRKRKLYQRTKKRGNVNVEEVREEYKRSVREYKCAMSKAKENDWREFVSKEGNRDPWGEVYKLCRSKRRIEKLRGVRGRDGITSTWEESVNVLLNEFFPPAVAEMNEEYEMSENACFEWDELDNAVKMMRTGKAPGLDGMSAEIVKRVWLAIPRYMKALYDECLRTNCFPNEWKIAKVIVLLKSPDKDRMEPRSYRPISLLSVFGKVLERMMMKRLMNKVMNGMNDKQYGFRAGRSTEDAWNRVKEWVSESNKRYVLGVSVDFKGAFNWLCWESVMVRLRMLGCTELGIWRSYFTNRKACVVGINGVVWKDVCRGCPQGSISGPVIWNVMIDVLLWKLEESECKVVAYADDLLLVIEGVSRNELEKKATEWMKHVSNWGRSVGVSVSETKTVSMLLKGRLERPPNIRMNEVCLRYVDSLKYLGINIKERMKFKIHLQRTYEKVMNVVGVMRRVLRKNWGLKKKIMCVLYKGLFVSCAMYGASAWYECMRFQYAKDCINRCQRSVLYACLRVCRTVSTEAMQVLMGELPWDLECERRAVRFKVKNGIRMTDVDVITEDEVRLYTIDDCMRMIDERLHDKWQARWNESTKGRVTYEFIKNVRLVRKWLWFEPGLYMGYLLTGHGSMNDYLMKRGLSESNSCICGAERENWKHILIECDMYDEIRDLNKFGVIVREDESVDVSGVLENKERYECVNEFAKNAFERRKGE